MKEKDTIIFIKNALSTTSYVLNTYIIKPIFKTYLIRKPITILISLLIVSLFGMYMSNILDMIGVSNIDGKPISIPIKISFMVVFYNCLMILFDVLKWFKRIYSN